ATMLPESITLRLLLYLPKQREPLATVLIFPIFRGRQEVSHIIAQGLVGMGFSCIILARGRLRLDPDAGAGGLNEQLKETAREGLLLYRYAKEHLRREKIAILGTSLGSFQALATRRCLDRFAPTVLLLCGADLPTVMTRSTEGGTVRYRKAWIELRDASRAAFLAEHQKLLTADPTIANPWSYAAANKKLENTPVVW
ncbi:MAG: hypothetical protein IIB17_07145, partial [Chloroflexi bacterium]|nr:hypothetical protein [Chloroflexota bacterium]